MKLVASKKLNLVHGTPTIDRASVKQAILSGSGVTYRTIDTDEALAAFLAQQTSQGFVCHVFDYVESHKSTQSIQSFRAA